uniref:Uncharacterized protein n=1 Tax=Heterorhabditis bacteriophora TaxID=37862 RepID=A0A1I7WBC1_HETBA
MYLVLHIGRKHINIICIYNMKYNTFLQLSKFYRSHDQIFSVVQNYYLNTELIVELLLVLINSTFNWYANMDECQILDHDYEYSLNK